MKERGGKEYLHSLSQCKPFNLLRKWFQIFLFWLQNSSPKEEADEETDSPDEEPDKARFTLQELRDVLQEKNELKAQVFMLQEELAYYQR